jgi:capsular exopolysaccharide synthesis family protein
MLCAFYFPKGRAAEAFRGIRTVLIFRGGARQIVQVTSPSPGDGKSTLSANLAISCAQSGKRVLLIDADFRRPKVNELFGVSNDYGLSSVLEGTTELSQAIRTTQVKSLWLLTSGPSPSNPCELLGLPRFAKLLGVLRGKLDFVIIDTPPVLAVTDPLVICNGVDRVLLVARLTRGSRRACRSALNAFDGLDANIFGIVINRAGTEKGYANDYYYQYGYQHYGYSQDYVDDRNLVVDDGRTLSGHIEQKAANEPESES